LCGFGASAAVEATKLEGLVQPVGRCGVLACLADWPERISFKFNYCDRVVLDNLLGEKLRSSAAAGVPLSACSCKPSY